MIKSAEQLIECMEARNDELQVAAQATMAAFNEVDRRAKDAGVDVVEWEMNGEEEGEVGEWAAGRGDVEEWRPVARHASGIATAELSDKVGNDRNGGLGNGTAEAGRRGEEVGGGALGVGFLGGVLMGWLRWTAVGLGVWRQ